MIYLLSNVDLSLNLNQRKNKNNCLWNLKVLASIYKIILFFIFIQLVCGICNPLINLKLNYFLLIQ